MADQLPGVLERCLLSSISKEEAEFYDSFNGASPRQLDEGVTHLETPKSDTIEGQVLISVDETAADNDVLVLDPDSSTDGVLDYNLALTAAVVSQQEHTGSHDGRLVAAVDGIDNVLAEANLHCDEQYVNAITTCCLHTLRGFFCLKPGKCPGQGHLCKEYQNGVCPFTGFEHDSAFHIVRSCITACDEGQCFNADCKYGHDNFGIRRERWQQAKCEVDRDNIDNTTCEMLEVLERAMGRNGTALNRFNAKKTATSLVKRMKAKMGNGENVIRSSLKREAQKTINRYSDWVQRSS
ncbi:hypothetical protein EG328_002837 [Venturia inaequalis]|uniref:Uncharacterized protein n=1 Tax=Venturia inaequalis TaxID=5025 RepID=A0A8H3USV8_VENIN|nr:hypothetical protein EG328_002837 [Venturia inaequalis]